MKTSRRRYYLGLLVKRNVEREAHIEKMREKGINGKKLVSGETLKEKMRSGEVK